MLIRHCRLLLSSAAAPLLLITTSSAPPLGHRQTKPTPSESLRKHLDKIRTMKNDKKAKERAANREKKEQDRLRREKARALREEKKAVASLRKECRMFEREYKLERKWQGKKIATLRRMCRQFLRTTPKPRGVNGFKPTTIFAAELMQKLHRLPLIFPSNFDDSWTVRAIYFRQMYTALTPQEKAIFKTRAAENRSAYMTAFRLATQQAMNVLEQERRSESAKKAAARTETLRALRIHRYWKRRDVKSTPVSSEKQHVFTNVLKFESPRLLYAAKMYFKTLENEKQQPKSKVRRLCAEYENLSPEEKATYQKQARVNQSERHSNEGRMKKKTNQSHRIIEAILSKRRI
eukprot:PhM_4_TR12471/c0_g1_i1/m.22651